MGHSWFLIIFVKSEQHDASLVSSSLKSRKSNVHIFPWELEFCVAKPMIFNQPIWIDLTQKKPFLSASKEAIVASLGRIVAFARSGGTFLSPNVRETITWDFRNRIPESIKIISESEEEVLPGIPSGRHIHFLFLLLEWKKDEKDGPAIILLCRVFGKAYQFQA